MLEPLLKRLGIPPSGNYAERFKQFVRCVRPGQDYAMRLERALAALGIGDYVTALQDARWCSLQQPTDADVLRTRGISALACAAGQLMPLPVIGAGAQGIQEAPADLLEEARRSFQRTLAEAPADEKARLGLQAVDVLTRQVPVAADQPA